MLYDPKWEVTTKPDVFSLEGLIAWLETMPADGAYDYCYPGECLTAQYLKARGVKDNELSCGDLRRLGWKHIAQNTNRTLSDDREWTFGAALGRARAAFDAEERGTQ